MARLIGRCSDDSSEVTVLLEGQISPLKTVFGRSFSKQRPPASDRCSHSHLGLLCEFKRIVDLNTEVPYSALEFGMPKEQLHSPQVLRSLIDG